MKKLYGIQESGRHPLIMGILNVTPDSFSGDGVLNSSDYVNAAVRKALEMLEQGAEIIDIGGESSRPGSNHVGVEDEIRRTIPVIRAIRKELGHAVLLSIDTCKPDVAKEAIGAGINILNDVSGLNADMEMYNLAAKNDVYLVLMHSRGDAGRVTSYENVVDDVISELGMLVGRAKKAGVVPEKIIVDPGIGFGKTVEHNLKLINDLDKLKTLGCSVMVGPSRKNFIGQTLNLPVQDRVEGTAASVAASVMKGADIVRVHDVKAMARVTRMVYAIKNS